MIVFSSVLANLTKQWPHRKTKDKLVERTLNKENHSNKEKWTYTGEGFMQNPLKLMESIPQTSSLNGCMGKWAIIWNCITIRRWYSECFQGKQLITSPTCLLGDHHRASYRKGGPKSFISPEVFHNWGIKWNQCYSEAPSPFSSGNFNCHVRFQMTLLMLCDVEMQVWPWACNISFTRCGLRQTDQPALLLPPAQPLPQHSDLFRILTNSSLQRKVHPIWVHDRKPVIK